jgi:two-component system sensor histidine kinase RegB
MTRADRRGRREIERESHVDQGSDERTAASAGGVAPAAFLRLRWAILGVEAAAILVAALWLRIDIPLAPLLAVTAAGALANAFALILRPGAPSVTAFLLVLDSLRLTLLLHFSGGPMNPFSVVYLVQITLAAVVLGLRWTLGLAALSVAGYGALFVFADTAALQHVGHGEQALDQHLRGMWWAFVVAALLTTVLVARLRRDVAEREARLLIMRERVARSERFAALTTLAAGAAHELGTPLASIAVAACELERGLDAAGDRGQMIADARMIRQEVERCRAILAAMSEKGGEPMGEAAVVLDLADLATGVRDRLGNAVAGRTRIADGPAGAHVVAPPRALRGALTNLLQNALDAAPGEEIEMHITCLAGRVRLEVRDRGPGLSEEVRARIGEPFFTTKPPGKGMGLGVFVVRTLAERLGGSLVYRTGAGGGTIAVLDLPAAAGRAN